MTDKTVENKVMVNIFGDEYPITGVTDPAYITRVADYVDSKMKETAKGSRVTSRDKIAILAAMSIASELYEKKDSADFLSEQMILKIDNALAKIDTVLN